MEYNIQIEDINSNVYYPYTRANNILPVSPYFYENGKEYPILTGGWELGNHGTNFVSKFEKNLNFMYLESSSSSTGDTSNCACNTILQIDVTNLKNICIEWENTGASSTDNQSRFGLTDIKNGLPNIKLLTKQSTFSKTISKIDVSTISGCYWLEVCTKMINSQASKLKIYKIYGE